MMTTPLTPALSARLPSPLNIPFANLPRPTRDISRLRKDLFRAGFCYIKDGMSAAQVSRLRARLTEQMAGERAIGISSHDGGKLKDHLRNRLDETSQPNQKVLMLVNKGQCFRELVTDTPEAPALVDELLGKKWILASLWANVARPGGEPQAMHCDQGGAMPRYFSRSEAMAGGGRTPEGFRASDTGYAGPAQKVWDEARPFTTESLVRCINDVAMPDTIAPPAYCQVVYFLSDVSYENGGTCVVPGSHLTGMLPPLSADFTKLFPTANFSAPAGTVAVFDGRLWHAAGANVTHDVERPLIFQFCCSPNFRQQEAIQVGIRPEVYRDASPALRARLGFQVWGPFNFTEKITKLKRRIGFEFPRPGELAADGSPIRGEGDEEGCGGGGGGGGDDNDGVVQGTRSRL